MSNHLEDFISNNRNEFDSETPSGRIWENIEASFSGKKKKATLVQMPFFKWGISAAAILIIGMIVFLQLNKKPSDNKELAKTQTEVSDPQVNEFARLINMKQEELKVLAKDQPQLYEKFTSDIDQLDSSYKVLKQQLVSSPNKELLLEAMIQNLQLQLNVLNQQLNIINQIKQTKKYSHEKDFQTI